MPIPLKLLGYVYQTRGGGRVYFPCYCRNREFPAQIVNLKRLTAKEIAEMLSPSSPSAPQEVAHETAPVEHADPANIQAAILDHPKLDPARSDYAERLVEIITGHTWRWLQAPHQKRPKTDNNCRLPRLVARVERLLAPKRKAA
jgi:hypothetical protein